MQSLSIMRKQHFAPSSRFETGQPNLPLGIQTSWLAKRLLHVSYSIKRFYNAISPILVMTSCGWLLSANAYAQIVANPSAPGQQRPTVVNTGNGVLQVNIQTPSAAGVSRNSYSQFDIPNTGAVLNNSRINTQSQIGGSVQANPWLSRGEARIILNEIQSANPSQIRGFIEVAGSRAEVVIANPAGINVDGGGFINVSRATLTTGTPIVNGGNLEGYIVDRGQINLSGTGLDARQTDYTSIIARSVAVNAGIWAQQLGVITGPNQVSINNALPAGASASSITGNGAVPQYAIDVSQLGGMYANKIVLLGTEAGVGVHNAGSIGASAGEIIVTANGRVENKGDIAAKQEMRFNVTGEIANAGNISSESTMALNANSISNNGTLNSRHDIQIVAGTLTNHGVINSSGETAATVEGAIDNSDGTIQAQRIALSSTTAGIDNQRGKITQVAVSDLDLTAQSLVNTNTGIIGTPATNNGSPDPNTGNGGNSSGGSPDAPDPDNQNSGNGGNTSTPPLVVPSGYLRAAGVINNDGGQVTAGGSITANVANLDNSGGNLNLRTLTVGSAGIVNHQGNINVTGDLLANGGVLENQGGKVMVGGNLQSAAAFINNQTGTIQARRLSLNVSGNLDNTAGILRQNGTQDVLLTVDGTFNNEGGTLETLGNLAVQANKITGENGKITAQDNLHIDSADASVRSGQWVSGGNATVNTAALDNTSGTISSGAALNLHSASINNQSGKIVANNIEIRTDSTLDNSLGTIQGVTGVDVQASSTLTNDGGTVEAIGTASNLNIQADKITNANGRIVNAGNGNTTIVAQTSVANGGTIAANGSTILSASSMQNLANGSIVSQGPLALNVSQQLDNAGTVNSANTLQINTSSANVVNAGKIVSAGKLSVNADNFDNANGQLGTVTGTGADIALTVGTLLNHAGAIQADANLSIDSSKAIDNIAGLLHGGVNTEVHSGTTINNDNGAIESAVALTVAAQSISNGSGHIVNAGVGNTIVTSTNDITNNGVIVGNGALNISASTLLNNLAGTIASGANLDLGVAQELTNQGTLNSNGALTFNQAGANFNNSGKVNSGGNISIVAKDFNNNNGSIETGAGSAADFSLTSQSLTNSAGHIVTDRDLNIQTQQLLSAGELSSGRDLTLAFSGNYTTDSTSLFHANRDLNLVTNGTLTNTATLEAGQKLILSAGIINNNAGGVIQAQDVTLTASNALNNAGEINAANDLSITAGTINNSNSIVGDRVIVNAQNLNNSGTTTLLGSTGDMSLWIGNQLKNTNGATIYSAGNMSIASGFERDNNGLLIGRTALVDNTASTIEAGGNLDLVANTVNNTRPGVQITQVTTVNETRHLSMPSWWYNGNNDYVYSPFSSNHHEEQVYFVNPGDILENGTYITPDGYTVGRAVIRTHASDSIFFTANGGAYGGFGHTDRLYGTDGTQVIYYTLMDNMVNPDQVAGTDGGLEQLYPSVWSWNSLPTFSSQYGSCSTNCIRIVSDPGYNPLTTILRDTSRYLAPSAEALEVSRDAHHVAVDDVLSPTAGAEAKILSGGNMRISVNQALNNQYASIMASGALQVDGGATAAINNIGQTLYRTHTFDGTWYTANGIPVHYDMPSISEVIGSVGGVMSGNQGVAINGRSFNNIDVSAGTAANIHSSVQVVGSNTGTSGTGANQATGGSNVSLAANTSTAEAISQSNGAGSVVPVAPSGLFQQSQDGNFLFTTRAPFTQGNAAAQTNSDFFFNALNVDPALVQKRLGDGYYEQNLVREQLAELTGKLSGNANDDTQYKELMTAGVSVAKEWNLTPGVALTADQVAHLTSDIVWMENQVVTLPDGTTQTVLVPKVYLAHVQDDALKPSGAIVTGNNVVINAGDITNKGGLIDGGNGSTVLLASNDISNLGGSIYGKQITLAADGDIRNETLTVTEKYSNSQNKGSFTSLSNQATISAGDSLVIQAKRDVTDIGGQISAGNGQAEGTGNILISAGRDLNLNAVQTGSDYQVRTAGYSGSASEVINHGSQITSGSNLTLSAGQDIALNGAQVAIGTNGSGSGTVVAGRDISLKAVTNDTATDAGRDPNSKGYSRLTTDNQTVVSTQVTAKDGLTLKAGAAQTGNLTVTGSAVAAGGDTVLAASGDVNIQETMERHYSDLFGHSSSKGFLTSSSSTTSEISDKQLVAGSNVSGNTVKIVAGNDVRVSGSQVTAQQDLAVAAGRDLIVTSATATDTESYAHDESKRGFSFSAAGPGYVSASSNQNRNSATTTEVGSVLTGGTVTTSSSRDTVIKGSKVVADGDISLIAGGNLSILSAENTSHSNNTSSSKKSGTIGTFLQPAVGTIKSTGDGTSDSVTQTGSQIASLGGNVSATAGGKYTQTASDVLALDGNIAINAKDVLINEAYNSYTDTEHQTYSKTAIGGSVDMPIVRTINAVKNTAESMSNVVKAASTTSNDRMKALAAATAGLQAYNLYSDVTNPSDTGNFKVSISLGSSKSESSMQQTGKVVQGSTVAAAGDVSIVASGAQSNSNINIIGSDISAGKNTMLVADNAVNLAAAWSQATQTGNNSSSGTSIGIGFSLGQQNGFTLDIGANMARGKSNGTDLVATNTHVTAGDTAVIVSGGDTNLKGAVVKGDTVVASIGGNLNIESLQDVSTYDSKQTSAGVNVSLCIPPFCAGTSSASGNYSQQNITSTFQSVNEQSGIKTGNGGFDISVAGNTDLKGAIIASSEQAAKDDKNILTTGTLTTSDIQNHASYSGSSIGIGVSYSNAPAKNANGTNKVDAAGNTVKTGYNGYNADLPAVMSASGSADSVTPSGISTGTVVITNDQKQQELTAKDAATIIASINRDVSSDKDTSNALNPIFNEKEIQAGFEITSAFASAVGTFLANKGRDATQKLDIAKTKQEEVERILNAASSTPEQIASAQYDLFVAQKDAVDAAKWAPGGDYNRAANILVLAASSNVTGSASQLAQSAVVNYVQMLGAEQIKLLAASSGIEEGSPTHAALHAILGCAGAAAANQGCTNGATGAAASALLNGLLNDADNGLTPEEKTARKELVTSLVAAAASATSANATEAVRAATLESIGNADGLMCALNPNQPMCGGFMQIPTDPKAQKALLSAAMNGLPLIGEVKAAVDAILGKDVITNEDLSTLDRVLNGVAGASGLAYAKSLVGELKAAKTGVNNVPRVFTSTDPIVGKTATDIEKVLPGVVEDVNVPIKNSQLGLSSDADIKLKNGDVIEVKSGGGKGATTQVANQTKIIGDSGEVMVYGPELKPSVINGIQKSGTKVFTNLNDLINYIKSKGL